MLRCSLFFFLSVTSVSVAAERVRNDDGSISFELPSGWVAGRSSSPPQTLVLTSEDKRADIFTSPDAPASSAEEFIRKQRHSIEVVPIHVEKVAESAVAEPIRVAERDGTRILWDLPYRHIEHILIPLDPGSGEDQCLIRFRVNGSPTPQEVGTKRAAFSAILRSLKLDGAKRRMPRGRLVNDDGTLSVRIPPGWTEYLYFRVDNTRVWRNIYLVRVDGKARMRALPSCAAKTPEAFVESTTERRRVAPTTVKKVSVLGREATLAIWRSDTSLSANALVPREPRGTGCLWVDLSSRGKKTDAEVEALTRSLLEVAESLQTGEGRRTSPPAVARRAHPAVTAPSRPRSDWQLLYRDPSQTFDYYYDRARIEESKTPPGKLIWVNPVSTEAGNKKSAGKYQLLVDCDDQSLMPVDPKNGRPRENARATLSDVPSTKPIFETICR